MWIPWAVGFFCCVVVTRLLPGSACDRNTMAKIAVVQKVSRAIAFNRFMVLLLFLRASVVDFCFSNRNRTVADSLRFGLGRDTAQGLQRNASKISCPKSYYDDWPSQ